MRITIESPSGQVSNEEKKIKPKLFLPHNMHTITATHSVKRVVPVEFGLKNYEDDSSEKYKFCLFVICSLMILSGATFGFVEIVNYLS